VNTIPYTSNPSPFTQNPTPPKQNQKNVFHRKNQPFIENSAIIKEIYCNIVNNRITILTIPHLLTYFIAFMIKSITQKGAKNLVRNLKNYRLSCTAQIKYFSCLLILLFSSMGLGQTILLSPTGDGGFESGSTFTANGWTNIGSGTRTWQLGTLGTQYAGSRHAYVGSTSSANGINSAAVHHFYKDFTIPAGATNVLLSYYIKFPAIDVSGSTIYDYLKVFNTTNSNTPVSGTVPTTGYTTLATYGGSTITNYTQYSHDISTLAGTIVRLVFSFNSDGVSPHINPFLDNISLTYTSPPPCSGTPTPGNSVSSVNPLGSGSSTVLSLQNTTTGSGVTYQWKSSTDNVTYTSISGATNATYTATPMAATYYVCDVTCSGVTTTSNPVQVTLTYCTPTSSSSSTYFSGFTTSGGATNISNNPTAFSLGGYVNYSSSMAVSQFATGTVNFSATIVGGTAGIAIFVDYNNDFDFTDVGETVYNSAAYLPTGTTNSSFVIPSGTVVGNYRMRIITDYNVGTPASCSFASGSRGEIEDYTLTVVAQPSCMIPTALASSAISYQTATIGWTAPASGASPASYEYEVRTSGAAGSGATGLVASGTITAPTVSASLLGLNGATMYSYYVRSNCGSGDFSSWTSATFTTLSCNVPTAVTSSAITTNTATISWTAPATGSPAGYEYEVRTSGTAGSGATGLIASGTTTALTVSASLNALTAATSYSVYIRTNCYSGFNSSWTSAVTFATLCNSITTFPFTESFQGITTGIPICWGIAGTLASSSSYHFGSSASGQTGRGLIFNSYSSSSGSTSELITPTLDLSTLTTAELKFYFKNPTGGNFEVLISTDNGVNYTSLQSSLTGQTAWLQKTYTITSYISSTVKIKFKGTSNYGSGDAYVYLDEIIVQAVPTCFPVTALTSSAITYQTATIGWTAPTNGTSPAGYEYEIRTSGAAGSGATGLVTSGSTTSPTVSANLTGLTGGTTYSYYVRSNCGGGDFSSWSSATFSTTSCSVPTAVTSSAITTTTATVSWTAPATGSLAGYEYEIRTSGAAGSGATGLVITGTTTAPTVSASLTGLTASSSYSVYFRTNCYSGFNSSWTSAVTFATLCNPISTFPYSENFDGVTTPALPNCWSVLDVNADGDKWITYTGYSQSGNNSVGLYTDYNAGANNDFLISPQFNLSGIKRLKYSVRARSSGEPNDYRVLLSTTGSSASDFSTVLLPLTSVSSTSYSQVIIDLSMYSGNVYIAFNVPSGGLDGYYIYIDDVIIEDTPNTWTGTTSNSWNTSGNWSLGTVPTSSDNIVISSNGSNAPVMDVDVTIPAGKSLTLTGGELTIAPGKVLTIAGTANFGGRPVTFKSDATGAGMFGPLTGTLTGATNVKVERYIPSGKRAFRLLSPAVTTTTFISGNWQGQTHITGGASGGFDATETNNPSMYTYNNQVASGSGWTPITNTNATNLMAGVGYRMLVRGDRTPTNITTATTDNMNSAITLSATGTLKTGTVALNASSTPAINNTANTTTADFSLVGNPYQSTVDWNAVTKSGIDATYYAWDPNMGTTAQRGRYVVFNGTTNDNVLSQVGQYIQPGQAFFVKNTVAGTAGTLTFQEAHKATTNANVFRTANQTESTNFASLSMQLYDPNELAIGGYPIDATKAVFSAEYTNELGLGDATKLEAAGENIAWFRNNTKLAIDAAAPVTTSDELAMKTMRLGVNKNYTFKIQTTNFDSALTPYLVDTFLNTQTEISTSQAYLVSFATTSNLASYSENRFKVVFQNAVLSTDTFASQVGLYPNPSKGNGFYLQLPSSAQATVKLYNTIGQEIGITNNSGYYQANQSLAAGVYHIMVTQGEKTSKLKWIVE
jgi:hypothetical protein